MRQKPEFIQIAIMEMSRGGEPQRSATGKNYARRQKIRPEIGEFFKSDYRLLIPLFIRVIFPLSRSIAYYEDTRVPARADNF